jgi:hypothetical protein
MYLQRLQDLVRSQFLFSRIFPSQIDGDLAAALFQDTRPLALPQNLWVKGSNISRMEAFGFFAFPR